MTVVCFFSAVRGRLRGTQSDTTENMRGNVCCAHVAFDEVSPSERQVSNRNGPSRIVFARDQL